MASNTASNTKILKAIHLGSAYGGIDGAHHKAWVITEMLKVLMGPAAYKKWRKQDEADGYEWDEGIAP